MTIRLGDHMVIKRDGKVLTEKDEAYHEFEVDKQPEYKAAEDHIVGYTVHLKLVK